MVWFYFRQLIELSMEAYQELLQEFTQKDSIQKLDIAFRSIFDQMALQTKRHQLTIKKKKMELKNIKKLNSISNPTQNDQTFNASSFLQLDQFNQSFVDNNKTLYSHNLSRDETGSELCLAEEFNEKSIMNNIEKKELNSEIEQLNRQILNLKQENHHLTDQIALIAQKEQQIRIAGKQSQKQAFLAKQQYKHSTQRTQEELSQQQRMLLQLHQKKADLKMQLNQLADRYEFYKKRKFRSHKVTQNLKVSFLEMSAQTEQSTETLSTIYSKCVLEQMLKTLFLIKRMWGCWRSEERFEVEGHLKQLWSKAEIRLMSKAEIISFYEVETIAIEEVGVASLILSFYEELENNFDRLERANVQISETFRQLRTHHEQLNFKLQEINLHQQKNTIISLEQRETTTNKLAHSLNSTCKFIFQFNTRIHGLIKKITNFHHTFHQILDQTHPSDSTHSQDLKNAFLDNFQKLLEKNPEDLLIEWNKAITDRNGFRNEEGSKYVENVLKNDLLRVHAKIEMYSPTKTNLENEEQTYKEVLAYEQNLLSNLFKNLSNLLGVTFKGIKHLEAKKFSQNQLFDSNKLNRLKFRNENTFCVESKDYYRRDNYRLLEKLEKEQLKKKGFLSNMPFDISPCNELIQMNSLKKQNEFGQKRKHNFEVNLSPRELTTCHSLNRSRFSYKNLASRREEESNRKQSIRKVLSNLSHINSINNRYRMQRQTHQIVSKSRLC